jgi:aryl-alcohol dehydrogenase-like predicted oxidoreductase
VQASLRRLAVDSIGVYQLHGGVSRAADAEGVVEVLEDQVASGDIQAFGTSDDSPEVIEVYAAASHAVSVQSQVNVFGRSDAVLAAARRHGLVVLARSPLAMGLLTDKYHDGDRPRRCPARHAVVGLLFDAEAMP